MKHLRKLALCLTVVVCCAVIGWMAPARADGAGNQDDPYVIDSTTTAWTNGWYTVNENTTIGTRVTVSGNVHLILCDGVELSIPKGIGVTEGNSLTIYGQEGNTGKLTINDVEDSNAGIGGSLDRSNINCSTGGSVTINGGTLDVTGGKNSAGIGGSGDGNVGTVTVNGGTVTVTGGKFGAGIGGGGSIDGNTLFFLDGTVTINGGKVTATGGEIGAGIGCGYCASGEDLIITINGGEVIATGISGSAGIGGGWGNAGRNPGGTITINGGKVTATYNGNGVGIGGWDIGTLITLGCANASDSIYASSYESTVNVAEGKYLKDSESGQYYTGEDIDITAIAGRTLVKAEQPNAVTLNTTVGGTVTLSATLAEEDTPITITVDPDADFCLDSLIAAYEENGTVKTVALTRGTGDKANEWTFTMPAADVTVSATFAPVTWTALQSALNAGGTVTLVQDIAAEATDTALTVPADTTVTLDLNGHVIDRHLTSAVSGGNVITVNGNLTVKDTGTGGKITGGKNSDNGGGVIVNSGSFTLENGSVTGNTVERNDSAGKGGGVFVNEKGVFNMTGGSIADNTSTGDNNTYCGGGVYAYGPFNMSGGSITGNTADSYGGGVFIANNTFNMNDGIITGNTANNGGGVYFSSHTFNMNGGSITGNTATQGGGVYLGSDTFNMNDGSITDNTANSYGGGVYVKGTFNMNGGNITGNSITSNTVNYKGGGVYVSSGTLNVSGAPVISGNTKNDSDNNFYLPYNMYIRVPAGKTLESTASIGVTMQTPGVFTSGLDGKGTAENFFSDSNDYRVRVNGDSGEAELYVPTYSISNTVTGGTVTASVNDDPSPVTGARYNDTVTLMAIPDYGYILRSLTYTPADGAATEITTTLVDDKYTGSFIMPAADVTVDAVFVMSIGHPYLSITLDERYVTDGMVFAYTGKPVEPVVAVVLYVDGEEVPLVQGTDYTVAYTDNTGSPDEATDAAVTLTGIGDYGGSKTIPFRISPFDFTKCKATVPNPTYNDGYDILYYYEGNDGGIVVKDSKGMTLTFNTDYRVGQVDTLEPEKYEEGGEWYDSWYRCSHAGESCRVTLEGCGDWFGTLTADIVISLPSHEGDGWSFEAGVLSISDAATMTPKDSYAGYPWFEYSNSVTDIVIGDGITSVPYMAFGGDSSVNPYANVKKVTLPASMKTIGESAFAYMTALTSIDLKNVTDIGITAFNQCVSLEVNVPGTVTSIGGGAFGACKRVAYAVTVSDIENGTVSADVNYAEAGKTVTLTAKPDEDCALDTLTVTTVSGEPVTVENGAFTMPGSNVIVSAIFFTPWQSLQNALNAGGTVTLEKNYTALASDSALEVPEGVTVTLDLNGHTIDRNLAGSEDVYDSVIIVKGNLTVTDSATGGTITGGNDSGVYVDENGAFTLSGGEISGNYAKSGGGVSVYSRATFTMTGGSITGNTAQYQGGGVNVCPDATFCVSGSSVITGNTVSGAADNVTLEAFSDECATITIPADKTLSSDASIGVTMETLGVFTSGLSGKGTAANFFSDSDAYRVRLNSDGEAELYELAITFGDPDFVMPASLTTIEESAFEGMTNMTVVDAHGVTSVGANAFGGCTGLKQIRLDRDCAIDDLAFSGCGTVYVYAPAGGETQAYCSKTTNPCVFVEIDETLSSSTGQEGPVYQFPSGSTLPSIKP